MVTGNEEGTDSGNRRTREKITYFYEHLAIDFFLYLKVKVLFKEKI